MTIPPTTAPATALVRRPSPRLAEGLVSHISRQPVDVGLARAQWAGYGQALRDNGWRTVEVEPADDCPDSVFVEDPVVVYRDVAVVARSGAAARRAEAAGVAKAVRDAGYRVERITEPGTLDGGDVLKVGSTVYVGLTGRTNEAGARQLGHHLGVGVVTVPVTRVLHLKSAVTALPDGTVIGHPPLVDDPAVFPSFLAVPEEAGAHVVLLGGDTVLLAASAPRTADLLAGRGFAPVVVDIGEFEKLEGCVTCLSVRLRDH
ncbi:MAG TPA: N(G),N(G)-dimethylarginine dimethylaminohydrolase [Actinophytocola sp.]|uniref:dimethylargininase n=1 Tax=Actinophytocola sp. TaxID=1872138 RepID=UPI002F958289